MLHKINRNESKEKGERHKLQFMMWKRKLEEREWIKQNEGRVKYSQKERESENFTLFEWKEKRTEMEWTVLKPFLPPFQDRILSISSFWPLSSLSLSPFLFCRYRQGNQTEHRFPSLRCDHVMYKVSNVGRDPYDKQREMEREPKKKGHMWTDLSSPSFWPAKGCIL